MSSPKKSRIVDRKENVPFPSTSLDNLSLHESLHASSSHSHRRGRSLNTSQFEKKSLRPLSRTPSPIKRQSNDKKEQSEKTTQEPIKRLDTELDAQGYRIINNWPPSAPTAEEWKSVPDSSTPGMRYYNLTEEQIIMQIFTEEAYQLKRREEREALGPVRPVARHRRKPLEEEFPPELWAEALAHEKELNKWRTEDDYSDWDRD